MNQKKLIIFMPLIEIGGVKKNLLIIANFLCKKLDKVSLITTSNEYKNKLPKSEPNAKLSDVTWDDPRRYFVPPDNYILASMLKLILRY